MDGLDSHLKEIKTNPHFGGGFYFKIYLYRKPCG